MATNNTPLGCLLLASLHSLPCPTRRPQSWPIPTMGLWATPMSFASEELEVLGLRDDFTQAALECDGK